MKRALLFILVATIMCGCDFVSNSSESGADTQMRDELAPLYELLFTEVEKQTAQNLRVNNFTADSDLYVATKLAKDRVVNAANRLADQHKDNRQTSYDIYLPYLILTTDNPTHFRLNLGKQDLVNLGIK